MTGPELTIRAVWRAVGDGVTVMSDCNPCLSVAEAQRRIRRLDDEGLAWIEEPTRFDDYAGNAEIRRTAIQIGENCWGRTTWPRRSTPAFRARR